MNECNQNRAHTGQCAGLYPSQGKPESDVVILENTILVTREKLPGDGRALIVIVLLPVS